MIAWDIVAGMVGKLFLASPASVADAFYNGMVTQKFTNALIQTLFVFAVGFGSAIAAGLPLGVLMGAFKRLGLTFDIYLYILNATPTIALIPIIIVWLGLFDASKIFITWLAAVFPIIINTYTGVAGSDPDLVEAARSFGANKRGILLKVMLPSSVPMMMAGLKIGASRGIVGTIVAELFTAIAGVGGLLVFYGNTFDTPDFFATVILLIILAALLTQGLSAIESHLSRWKRYEIRL